MKEMKTLTFPDGNTYEIADKKCREDVETKVSKEEGKGLSTNDYDNAAKDKVDAIPEDPKYTDTVYDDTEVKQGLNQLKSDITSLESLLRTIQEKLNSGSSSVDTVTVNEINDMIVEYFENKTVSEVEA